MRRWSMPTPALSSATLPQPPPTPAPSARSGVASMPSSVASALPSKRTEASPSRTRSGRADLPSRFVVQSTGGQLREEEVEAADSAAAAATASTVAASELRISTFSRSGFEFQPAKTNHNTSKSGNPNLPTTSNPSMHPQTRGGCMNFNGDG
ncbi:hypothetical protein RJ640_009633 [Escallonia rubra]|uniref:Uncharacterized protein n=1 Tax=Escallonia rubra TaxID=112253 RepID=A0AA88S912_9ASTE|nr:hypothetical protein RJ640_009633 [Escallonia rubra]